MDLSILTPHAAARMQQRGIRPEALEDLLDFGAARHLHSHGREIVFWNKKASRKKEKFLPASLRRGGAKRRGGGGGVYAVVGANGVVITVGHRYRRIPRD